MKMETILAAKGPSVVTVADVENVRAAVALLVRHNVGALVVIDAAARPVGIVSERDIIRVSDRSANPLDLPIASVMTADVIYGSPEDDVEAVLQTMTAHHFRHMPILDGGRLAGIISIGDLVKAQLHQYIGKIDTLQTQLMNS